MTAKEMFEELGFKQTFCINLKCESGKQIIYEKIAYDYIKVKVHFFDDAFYVSLFNHDGSEFKNVGSGAIYKELLIAINKQVEELGWV